MLHDPTRLHTGEYRAYAILTRCRMLYTLEHGAIVSKPTAARWAQGVLFAAATFATFLSNLYVEMNNRGLFLNITLLIVLGLSLVYAWACWEMFNGMLEFVDVLQRQTQGQD